MSTKPSIEIDFASEKLAFEKCASVMKYQLDKCSCGFYASTETQRAWSLWISRAAIAGAAQ